MSEKEERITNVSRQKSVAAASDVKRGIFSWRQQSLQVYLYTYQLFVSLYYLITID